MEFYSSHAEFARESLQPPGTTNTKPIFKQRIHSSRKVHLREKSGLTSRETPCSTDGKSVSGSLEQGLGSQSHRYPSQQGTTNRLDTLWILEIVAVIVSIGALVAIAVILSIHNGSPISGWTFYLSLNTVVSILATTSKTTILFAVTAAISQGKWNLFRGQPGQLKLFQTIDQASRGAMGGLQAIWSSGVGLTVSLGAFISLMSLAFEPMIQAVITTHGALNNSTLQDQAAIGSTNRLSGGHLSTSGTSIYIGQDGNGYRTVMGVYTDTGLQAAIAGGFQTSRHANSSTQLIWSCPTGNCTWPTYESFAVCSKCYDISDLLRSSQREANNTMPDAYRDRTGTVGISYFGNASVTNYTLDYSGLSIDNWSSYLNASGTGVNAPTSEYMVGKIEQQPEYTLKFKDYESLLAAFSTIKANTSYVDGKAMWQEARPSAMECGLFLCLQTFNTTVRSGKLLESTVATTRRKVPQSWQASQLVKAFDVNQTALGTLDWNPIHKDGFVDRYDFQLDPSGLSATDYDHSVSFNATQTLLQSLLVYLAGLLVAEGRQFAVAYDKIGSGRVYSTPTLQSLYESSDLNETFTEVAKSMTAYFRNTGNQTQQGSVETWVIKYHVRWGFMTLPAFVVVGGAIFLCLSILQTQRHGMAAWKHNLIASMVFSVDADTRTQLRTALLSQKLDDVGEITVYMHDREDGVELSSKAFTEDVEDDEHGGVDAVSLTSAGLTATAGDSLMSTTPGNEFVGEVGLASPVQESPNLHPADRRF